MNTPRILSSNTMRPILHAAVLLFALAASGPALSSHIGDELKLDQQAVQANDSLIGALRSYEKLPESARAAYESVLAQQAEMRRARLLELIERNPVLATMRMLPPGLRERFPAAARANIEEDLRGQTGSIFAIVADDFERGISRKEYRFQPDGSSQTYDLKLGDSGGSERDLLGWTGRAVRLDATRINGTLLVKKRSNVQLLAAEGTTTPVASTGNVTPTTTPLITGQRRTLAILGNFENRNLRCSSGTVSNVLFGTTGNTVNTMFRESSRDLVSFTGDVVGPFTIPYSRTGSCDFRGWGSALDAAARAAGFDLTQYNHLTYVTPPNYNCGWTGTAFMPGIRSWIQSCDSAGLYAHELGHNLGLAHASTPYDEYGDASDPMGHAHTVRTNGPNQVTAGWVPTGELLDVYVNGAYAIAALQPTSNGTPQVLRLVKPDTNEFYYVSLRTNTGVDSGLNRTSFVDTLSIHRAEGRKGMRTYLLSTLPVGSSFVDSVNGLEIVNRGVTYGVATVSIAFTDVSCQRSAPTVAIDPATASAVSGNSVSYLATVTNRNTAACGTSSFSLTQSAPGGLSGSLSATSLAIAPGASASATWSVRSDATLIPGTYTLNLAAGESGGTPTTAHASFVALDSTPADTTPPSLRIDSPAPGAVLSGRATITATASDASGVTAVTFYAGTTLLNRDTREPYSASWDLRKASKGAWTLRVLAVDTQGNVSEQSIDVTVQ